MPVMQRMRDNFALGYQELKAEAGFEFHLGLEHDGIK
jgi:hypothetical protein